MMSFSRAVKYQRRSNPNSDYCCVPQCTTSGMFNSTVSFHHFPKDEAIRKIWMRNVRRENLVVKKTNTVCSRHFLATDIIHGGRRRVREGAVPVLFAWNDYSLPASDEMRQSEDETKGGEEEEEMDVELLLRCHDYAAKLESLACEEAQELVVGELRNTLDEVTLKQSFGLERFSASDDDIRFYTRFASYRHLQAFWKQIEPATRRMVRVGTQSAALSTAAAPDKATDPPRQLNRSLPLIDELFLFLVYLSLGLKEKDLGDRFNIHQSSVSRIVKTWANFLYSLLGSVEVWMSPQAIRAAMPSVFGKFSDTQVLIDSAEVRCQLSSSSHLQNKTFSLKGMIGVSPHGAVTFVSSLCSGSVTDRELFRKSGIIPLLDKDMAVMVNKGFRIDDLVPCKVYRPPFLSKKSQPSRDEAHGPLDISRLRMHVERTVRRVKESKLFDTVVPLTIAGSISQLFGVACLLTNYQNKPLAKA